MDTDKKKKALIDNLPKDWREQGAEKFTCSTSKIEKVVYGLRKDTEVFAYMVDLAEAEKKKEADLEKRLEALAS